MLRLIKLDGACIALNYSDVQYIKVPDRNRLYVTMRNEDVFDINGRDLHTCLQGLEDHTIAALAESYPGECGIGEPWIESIHSLIFVVPAQKITPKSAAPTNAAPYRRQSSDMLF